MRGDAVFTPTTVNGYKPETVDAFEAARKARLSTAPCFVNLAGFRSTYKDQQVTIQVPNVAGGIASLARQCGQGQYLRPRTGDAPRSVAQFLGHGGVRLYARRLSAVPDLYQRRNHAHRCREPARLQNTPNIPPMSRPHGRTTLRADASPSLPRCRCAPTIRCSNCQTRSSIRMAMR